MGKSNNKDNYMKIGEYKIPVHDGSLLVAKTGLFNGFIPALKEGTENPVMLYRADNNELREIRSLWDN